MAILSDLSQELVEEVLIRVPLTSLRSVRFTCKKWNDLSKDRSFIKKQIIEAKKKQAKECQMIIMMNYRVYLMSVDLHSNVDDPSIKFQGKLISLIDDQVDNIYRVLHCDGLLLCITEYSEYSDFKPMVWNPSLGQTRMIKPRTCYHRWDNYAIGYDDKKKNKILRFVDVYTAHEQICEFEVYSFESDSWKVLDVSPDWDIEDHYRGLSLKGNTYWYATDKPHRGVIVDFLICFDFTTERFGPRLPLPFHDSSWQDIVTLSSVGEEQLAVLFHDDCTLGMEIWITSKIEPAEVSWNKLFLAVDTSQFEFRVFDGSFFIDQKKHVVVVLESDRDETTIRGAAFIFGKNGYFKKVDLGEAADYQHCYPLVCSYVPSSVQIKQLT